MTPEPIKIDILLPVLNEEETLKKSVTTILEYAQTNLTDKYQWNVVIIDNGSTDMTRHISYNLCLNPRVSYLSLSQKGLGRAIRQGLTNSESDIFVYMDIDLSADMNYLVNLIEEVASNQYDISMGSRLLPQSQTIGRKYIRTLTSHVNSIIHRSIFNWELRDLQCGFKAFSRDVRDKVLHEVEDDEWLFISEFLIRAYAKNCKIKEIPIRWVDDPNSKMTVVKTSLAMIGLYLKLNNELFTK